MLEFFGGAVTCLVVQVVFPTTSAYLLGKVAEGIQWVKDHVKKKPAA